MAKSTHFLPCKITVTMDIHAKLYIREIVRLYGIVASIVSDKDLRFTSRFYQALQKAMGDFFEF